MHIYMDHAATTPVHSDVLQKALPYFTDAFGNPSSVHSEGRRVKGAIERARQQCAAVLNCTSDQLFFCGSATEADNWAIQMHHEYLGQWNKILYSSIEHKAILNSVDKEFDVSIPVDENGIVDVDFIKSACLNIANDKITVCVMWVNNEVGSI